MTFKIEFADNNAEGFLPSIYSPGIEFTMPHVAKDVITLCSDFSSCREVLAGQVRCALNGSEEFSRHKVTMRDGHLIIMYNLGKRASKALMDTYSAEALNIVHLFEERLGWKKSISFHDIDAYNITYNSVVRYNKGVPNYVSKGPLFDPNRVRLLLVKCPRKWLKSPHMLSLYMLLIRLAMIQSLANAKTIEEFNKEVGEVHCSVPKTGKIFVDTDHYVVNRDKVWLLLNNFTSIINNPKFKGTYHWRPKTFSYFKAKEDISIIMHEGIKTLCTGVSHAKELSAVFNDACVQNKIKHSVIQPKEWW
jgi:hypothetical protein